MKNTEHFDYKITEIRTKEEKDLLIQLTKFSDVFNITYTKFAPHYLAEYVYTLTKLFSSFYANCPINNETDENYKKSKLSLIYLVKRHIEICLNLLGIKTVEKM